MNLSKNNFDVLFKIILLVFVTYFLYILANIAMQIRDNADIGRYQFHSEERYILDTKTGIVKKYPLP
ncbi:hypothetical protein [Sediminibacterium sp.]|uniref:hypothetical protein n=1 Tax=Sediminibacterium sp. TaxID=1917865 RepID=UPI0025E477B3|nr:hypothetical protein [Sediminibacterium sp.]